MGLNIKKHWESMTADELRELYEEKTTEDSELISNLYVENEKLKAVNKEVKRVNLYLTWIIFFVVMIVIVRSWFIF